MRPASFLRAPWRVLLATAVAAAALTAWTVPARAEGEVVTITPVEGDPVDVSLDDPELVRDIDTDYVLRFSDGGADQRERLSQGMSLLNLLVAAGLDEAEFAYVEVARPDAGEPIRLGRALLTGAEPAAVYVDGDGVMRFIRRSTGPKDFNGDDWLQFPAGAMSMSQLASDGLKVKIDASARRIEAGETVHFTADVEGASFGREYEYLWHFGGNARGPSRPAVRHRYRKDGTYSVELTVSDVQDGTLAHAPSVIVQVGERKEKRAESGGGGSGQDDAAETDGSSGDGFSSGGTGYGYDSGSGYSYEGYDPSSDFTPYADTTPERQPNDGPGLAVDDGTVEGYLLADASSPPGAAVADATAAAREGFVEDEDEGAIPAAVWALLGTVALVTVGAGLEGGPRGPRLPVARVPRMRGGRLSRLLGRGRP